MTKILKRIQEILGFLDKVLGTSWFFLRGFCIKNPFCAFFFGRKIWHFLKFLVRSCKIVHILGALGKGFRKVQDSWQDLQDISHWAATARFKLYVFVRRNLIRKMRK